MKIPDSGSLRDYSLARILIDIKKKKATGTLSIINSRIKKRMYIKDGDPVFASSNVEEDRLGNMLIKAGKISISQYEKSVEILEKTGKRHGVILVELGYLTPRELLWGVKYQVANIIYSMFQLEDGEYKFVEGELPKNEVITLKIKMENLVYKSLGRINNWTRLRTETPPSETVLIPSSGTSFCKGIDLSAQDRAVLSLVNGRRSIGQIAEAAAGLSSFDVLKAIYTLLTTEFITEKAGMPAETTEDNQDEKRLLKKKVEEFYKRLGSMSKADILRINKSSDSETVKKNYYKMAKEFHPDRYHNLKDRELDAMVTAIFNAVTEAYNLMKDNVKRREYFNSPNNLNSSLKDAGASEAAGQFKRGVNEFKKGNYYGATDVLRWIVKNDPKNPEAWRYLSLSLAKIPGKLKEAETSILEAIRIDPFNSRYFSDLGNIYLDAGIVKRARQQFEKAIRIDPENDEAKKGMERTR